MSDFRSHHDLDDELLSAYLDDELSSQERAGVEARLAEDPAAREMLHQLRAVAQAVQGLPQEIVGHDLGDSILRRVSQSGPPIAPLASTPADARGAVDRATPRDDSLPKLTIGQSRRGWFRASLAVAGALLVMLMQSDREAGEKPQAVARRDAQELRQEGRRAANPSELELRALGEPAGSSAPSQDAAADLAGPSTPPGAGREMQRALAEENSPALEPASKPSDERILDLGTVAVSRPSDARGGTTGRSDADADTSLTATMPSDNAAPPVSAGTTAHSTVDSLAEAPAANTRIEDLVGVPSAQEQPVVVRVLARREALESKAFDRVLESNGIEVDAAAAEGASTASVRARSVLELTEQKELETEREKLSPQQPASGREEEVLLVDAPASAITSSLETLSADKVNYLGIAVDESAAPESSRRFDAGAAAQYSVQDQKTFAKKLQVQQDWTKYNRGVVPQFGYSLSGDKLYFYDGTNDGTDRYGTGPSSGGRYYEANPTGLAQPQELAQQRAPAEQRSNEQGRGRARRLQTWGTEIEPQAQQLARRRYVAPHQPVVATAQPGQPSQVVTELSGEAADRMQVLFVISPADVPASSAPARNKAQ